MKNLYYIVFEKYQSGHLVGKSSIELFIDTDVSAEYLINEIQSRIINLLETHRNYGEKIPEIIITNIINLTKLVA